MYSKNNKKMNDQKCTFVNDVRQKKLKINT